MKGFLFIFLTIYCSTESFSQTFYDTVISVFNEKKLLSQIASVTGFTERRMFQNQQTDVFEFGVKTYGEFFQNAYPGKPLVPIDRYKPYFFIQALTKNDTVFLVRIIKIGVKRKSVREELIYSRTDTSLIQVYLNQHNKKYSSSRRLNDFLPVQESGVFDLFCFGHPRKSADSLIALVRNKDHHALIQLASSLSLYERVFGTAGLFFLQLSGEKLTAEEEKLVLLNQESELIITTCNDHLVTYGQPIARYLESNYLKDLYKAIFMHRK